MPNSDYADLKPGDVLAGKYRVERVLGAGGMGVVVAAHHLQLDQRVALKFLLPHAARNSEAVARFLREARAAVKIKSEHVARVTDVGQLENGSPYIVMEYLEGSDLSGWLEKRGVLPVEQAVDFVLQACEALADAHSLGIVHRDLKPANLFCIQRSDGGLSIKVLDFGISKITTPGETGHGMTRTTALMGSPLYMSPEQMTASKAVDVRTDIWALGVILYELVSGRPPFVGEAITELAIKVATETPPLLRALRFDAPPGLERVLCRCLEKDRSNRFQNVGELAVALADFGPKSARLSVERALGTLRKAGLSDAALPPSGRLETAATALQPSSPDVGRIPQTAASWGQTRPGGGTAGTARMAAGKATFLVLGAAILVGASVGAVIVLRKPVVAVAAVPTVVAAASPPEPTASPIPTPPPPVAMTQTTASSVVPAVTSSNAPAQQPAPATSVKPIAKAVPSVHSPASLKSSPQSATPSPSPPPLAKNCSPPYVIDSSGHRQYKPECLN